VTPPLTYVFCLVRSTRRPAVGAVAVQLPGAGPLRLLAAGAGTWLVVTSVPEREYSEKALAAGLQDLDWVGPRAMAHEAVVESFLTATAVLPMQLFTLFTSDERALSHVTRQHKQIETILKRISGRHEWGLRMTWDEKAAREKVDKQGTRRVRSGADYLSRKRDLLDVNRVQLTAARSEAGRVYRALSREAAAAARRTSTERAAPGSRLLLDAAFLIPIKQAAAFRRAVRKQAQALESNGLVFSLTGPWPPYNFI
jgi:hypothetical protein